VFKRAKVVKDMVTAVFKQKKVFTLFGGPGYADDIRQGLLRRGWIERPPPRETDAYVLDPPPPPNTPNTLTHTLLHFLNRRLKKLFGTTQTFGRVLLVSPASQSMVL
jgi:hypothetical protein